MADRPFDQVNFGLRERPLSGDFNRGASQIMRTIRDLILTLSAPPITVTSSVDQPQNAFIGNALRVVPSSPAAMSVVVRAGIGFLYDPADIPTGIGATDLEGVSDLSAFKPLSLLSPVTFPVPAAPSAPNSRIDIIEVKNPRRLEDSVLRRQLDTGTESFGDHAFFKSLAFTLDDQTGIVTSPASSTAALSYKVGVAGNPGATPATTTGYTKIAELKIPNGISSVNGSRIVDLRPLYGVGGNVNASIRFHWNFNAGNQIATVQDVVAPPGVEFRFGRLRPGPESTLPEGDVLVYVLGGHIRRVSASAHVCSAEHVGDLATAVFQPLTPHLSELVPDNDSDLVTDAGKLAFVAPLTQAISVTLTDPPADGQQIAGVYLTTVHLPGSAGSPGTDSLIYQVNFTLGY